MNGRRGDPADKRYDRLTQLQEPEVRTRSRGPKTRFFPYNGPMLETLLRTKLFVPPLRTNLISRPHLVERVDQGLQPGHKLTFISAPAGFGKTTLVSEWVGNLGREGENGSKAADGVAWLSLDEGDNDPTRFLTYLIAALNRADEEHAAVGKGTLGMLQSSQLPPTETVLTPLINELAATPEERILILDDYHLIESQAVHEILSFLLENMPPQMHLVIATREDPNLPLARLRARGQLAELRAADLRFSPTEAAEFLNRVMGLNLSMADVAALESRTEGWIAGLQLAAISMQGHGDAAQLIKSFTGSHRLVMDYLMEDVLNQQPKHVQEFLLQTAVLSKLTGPLCDALTGQDDGQATMEMLERANLFIIPLDSERRWYRYHHLFADLLRQRLKQTQEELLPILHRRASEWHQQNEHVDESIEHALRGEDVERAVNLIEGHVDDLWGRGEHAKLKRWLDKLPETMVCAKPRICIFYAWYMFVSGQHEAADRSLQAMEQIFDRSGGDADETERQHGSLLADSDRAELQGRAAAVRAFMDSHQGDLAGMIRHARQALAYLPEHDRTWRGLVAIVLGDVYGFKGDMAAAYEARTDALKTCEAAGDIYYILLASMKVAITLRSQGRLQLTREFCQQQIEVAHESGLSHAALTGLLQMILGEVLAELNYLDEALAQATEGVELTERSVDLSLLGWGYMCLIRILVSRGEMAATEALVQKMDRVARESQVPPWIMNQLATWGTRLRLAQGKLDEASQWASQQALKMGSELEAGDGIDFFQLFDYIMLGRVLIAEKRLDEAAGLLTSLLVSAKAGGRTARVIEILLLQALACQAQGDIDQAISKLRQALATAEPEGFIRIFADEGAPMARLLDEALRRGIAPGYVGRLLAAFSSDYPIPADITTSKADPPELTESLSEREIEVLQLIAGGLTNSEIASRLYLSLNTVKAHTRNIYSKLDAHNRTQAVARARALNILTD